VRPALRFATPMLAVLTLVLLNAGIAGGVVRWCKRDPVVEIGGKRAHVYVSSYEEIEDAVTGLTKVRFTVPEGVSTELLSTDEGFAALGYDVRFVHSNDLRANDRGIQIQVDVRVPVDPDVPGALDLPVKVELTDGQDKLRARKIGGTNEWVTVRSWL
jgi:hypothetical protein